MLSCPAPLVISRAAELSRTDAAEARTAEMQSAWKLVAGETLSVRQDTSSCGPGEGLAARAAKSCLRAASSASTVASVV